MYGVFLIIILHHFKGRINIHQYANKIIYISDHGIKGLCLGFNLVPRFVI